MKKTHFCIYVCDFEVALLLISSCNTFKKVAKETVIESITASKLGYLFSHESMIRNLIKLILEKL